MDNQKKDLIVEKNVVEKDPHKAQKAESWERKMRTKATQYKIGIENKAMRRGQRAQQAKQATKQSRQDLKEELDMLDAFD